MERVWNSSFEHISKFSERGDILARYETVFVINEKLGVGSVKAVVKNLLREKPAHLELYVQAGDAKYSYYFGFRESVEKAKKEAEEHFKYIKENWENFYLKDKEKEI